MVNLLRRAAKRLLMRAGYEVRHVGEFGSDPFADMLKLTGAGGQTQPVIFDVGANVGNFVREFHHRFDNPIIHAFEPGPGAFEELQRNTAGLPNMKLNRCALGATDGELTLIENEHSELSSFLPPGRTSWGRICHETKVPVQTVDRYCSENGVDRIDVLKSDTQGFDLEVLRGAEGMIRGRQIPLIYMEITFTELYKGIPRLDEIYQHLHARDYRLVTFYRFAYQENRAGWVDALFRQVGESAR